MTTIKTREYYEWGGRNEWTDFDCEWVKEDDKRYYGEGGRVRTRSTAGVSEGCKVAFAPCLDSN